MADVQKKRPRIRITEGDTTREFELPDFERLTMGEGRVIKQLTGLAPLTAFRTLSVDDPDLALALMWLCMHRDNPRVRPEHLDDIEYLQFEFIPADDEEDEDPPAAAAAPEPEPGVGGGGSSETNPSEPGSPSSAASTDSSPGTSSD